MITPMKMKFYGLRHIDSIPQLQQLTEDERFGLKVVSNVLPFRTNNYVVEQLIDWSNIPDDPIYQLTFMQKGMLQKKHFNKMADALMKNSTPNEIKTIANEIRTELDPEINTQGVYAVQTIEGKEYNISAIVVDPLDVKIRDVSINRNSFEDNFEIDDAGTYTLIISTSESEEIPLVGGIGHVPDSTGVTISIAGFFVIVLGMIGIAVIGFMVVRQRKNKFS